MFGAIRVWLARHHRDRSISGGDEGCSLRHHGHGGNLRLDTFDAARREQHTGQQHSSGLRSAVLGYLQSFTTSRAPVVVGGPAVVRLAQAC